jgi:hypothetical protein
MIAKRLEDIAFEDIASLLTNEVRENRSLEYKSQLPHEAESSKVPFLAEVSALANTDGGDLIIGVVDDKGAPTEICGVTLEDPDKEVLRIEGAILSGIEPRIPSLSIAVLRGEERTVILIRVGKSWHSPHRVTFRDHSKFYRRNSAGKYPMDVSELRTAFLQSEQVAERIRSFRKLRLEKLKKEQELPVPLHPGAKAVLHLVPLSAFTRSSYVALDTYENAQLSLRPMRSSGWNHRYNLDGIVTFSGGRYEASTAYTQFFRNGIVEAVSSLAWYREEKCIASQAYEREMIEAAKSYLAGYRSLGIDPPVYFFISLLGIKEYRFAVSEIMFFGSDALPADRDDFVLPEGSFEDLSHTPDVAFRPFFDMIWNAYGYKRSFNYDENGIWVGQK